MGSDFADLAPDEQWREALAAAPRELFVPDVAWTMQDGLIDRHADPETWAAAVARNDAVVTQVADGEVELTAENVRRNPHRYTSSCSAPSLVLHFLQLLNPYPGDRVLEVGTGTGWTSALLSARLGADRVTSIEVDDQVAKQATASLEGAGFAPNLIVGDGAEGDPDGAPFDRVHVTCGAVTIPYTWVEQTRPGGIIVLPWGPSLGGGSLRTRLTVTGTEALGQFHGDAAFMPLRSQRNPHWPVPHDERHTTSRIDPRRISAAAPGLSIALAGLSPGVAFHGGTHNPVDGTFRVSLREWSSDSHALAIQPPGGGSTEVSQAGPRNLWDELETAYLTWVRLGGPGPERLGLEVDAEGQHIWLDRPDNRITEVAR